MQVSAHSHANPEGSVLYRSGLNPKIQRNFEVFSPRDFKDMGPTEITALGV